MLREAGAADAKTDEVEGGHSAEPRCLHRQREMPAPLKAPSNDGLAREYVELRPRLEMLFRKWFPSLRGQEPDFYNEAWESLLQAGAEPDCLQAWLERALYTRGLNELRRRARRPGDQAGADESARIERVFERTEQGTEEHVVGGLAATTAQELLLDRLSERQARIIKLHYGWGLTVGEVAAALSLSKRTVRRDVEEAAPRLAENAGWLTPCADGGRRSLVRAYVLGFLSDARAAKAAAHLDACASCRALREQIEETLRGVAAAVPPALVAEPPAADDSLLERLGQAAEAAREQVADVAASAKHQAVAVVTRTPAADTPGHIAAGGGLRGSGAMLATAASCLVVGGGTVTYCAVEGVPDPVRALVPGAEREPGAAEAESPPEPTPAPVEVTAPPALPESGATPTLGASTGTQSEEPEKPEPEPVPPAEEEFGIERGGGSAAASSSAEPQPPPAPAPAPAPAPSSGGGGEEFSFEQ